MTPSVLFLIRTPAPCQVGVPQEGQSLWREGKTSSEAKPSSLCLTGPQQQKIPVLCGHALPPLPPFPSPQLCLRAAGFSLSQCPGMNHQLLNSQTSFLVGAHSDVLSAAPLSWVHSSWCFPQMVTIRLKMVSLLYLKKKKKRQQTPLSPFS